MSHPSFWDHLGLTHWGLSTQIYLRNGRCLLGLFRVLRKRMLTNRDWELSNETWNLTQNAPETFLSKRRLQTGVHLAQASLCWCRQGSQINSLWPSDAIWRQEFRSTLVQVMSSCLTAPSHYLNQCWLIIKKDQWCSSEGNFAWDVTAISH